MDKKDNSCPKGHIVCEAAADCVNAAQRKSLWKQFQILPVLISCAPLRSLMYVKFVLKPRCPHLQIYVHLKFISNVFFNINGFSTAKLFLRGVELYSLAITSKLIPFMF